jgi:8-oxo-dGTP diphosphatase
LLYLVRHAKAGSRRDWNDDDELRPLSKAGRKQSDQIAERLHRRGITALVSSPYVRCVQTLDPLAGRCGLTVTIDDRLAEGNDFRGAIDLLSALPDGAVLCSHGDIVPAVIEALQRRGCEIATPADWRKATVWLVDRAVDGEFTHAKVWSPPT